MTFLVSDASQLELALNIGDLDSLLHIIACYHHHLLNGPLITSGAKMVSLDPRMHEGVGVMQLSNVLKEHARNEYDVTSVQLCHCIKGQKDDLVRFRCTIEGAGGCRAEVNVHPQNKRAS